MNKIQKTVISVAVPIVVILIGFIQIGYSGSYTYGNDTGVTFNSIKYFSRHGPEWIIVVVLITIFELFWWRTPKVKIKRSK